MAISFTQEPKVSDGLTNNPGPLRNLSVISLQGGPDWQLQAAHGAGGQFPAPSMGDD